MSGTLEQSLKSKRERGRGGREREGGKEGRREGRREGGRERGRERERGGK